MPIELSKQDANILQNALASQVTMLRNAIQDSNGDAGYCQALARCIDTIRELQSRIEKAQ